jgi:glycosyltransferase involved in cell wall biosynthesis
MAYRAAPFRTFAPSRGASGVKILIVTDAWAPQVNGVVRTLEMLGRELVALGHSVRFATPADHVTVPLPTYPEIRLALFPRRRLARTLAEFEPDAVHIATEGTLGLTARKLCLEQHRGFTTSYHTRFPEYVHARFPFIPESAVYKVLRRFHGKASATMVSTPSLQRELERQGFSRVRVWSRGVDVQQFHPRDSAPPAKAEPASVQAVNGLGLQRPVFLYVGRVAVEKNVEAFLKLDLPGTKLVVGDGPQRAELAARYPAARFVGAKTGAELVRHYAASDVFVFPSRTDTFGLVLLEALACGLPVAAYPVQAPRDVIGNAPVGVLDDDLRAACLKALTLSPRACRQFAEARSWRASTEQFLLSLVPAAHPAE